MGRIPRDQRKFLKRDSDRSGFTYKRRDLVRDEGWLVHPDEKDEPAPHPRFIGGEGEINKGEIRANRTAYPTPKTEIWSP